MSLVFRMVRVFRKPTSGWLTPSLRGRVLTNIPHGFCVFSCNSC